MEIGLSFANIGAATSAEGALAIARHAESLGFDSLWTVDHVVVPGGYRSTYPYSETGRMPGGEDAPICEPLTWLAWVGSATSRILLGTGMLVLPQRSVVVVAKEAATLAHLSGGRLRLGVGIGWLREEFDALGVPFTERAARAEEYIAAMRTLWREDRPTFEGRFVRFTDARMWPKPPGRTIPVIIGGHSLASARRAGRIGDGFFPGTRTPDELAPLIAAMREAAEEAGRDPAAIEITAAGRLDAATLDRLADLGVHRVVVAPRGLELQAVLEGLERSRELLRSAVGSR